MPVGSTQKQDQGYFEQFYLEIQANNFSDHLTPAERAHQSPSEIDELKASWLHAAASLGDAAACSRLIAEGVSTREVNFEGANALIMASREGYTDCVKVLIPASDPHQVCLSGMSALAWAAIEGHVDCVKLLIPVSNASSLDLFGKTALDQAIQDDEQEIVDLLRPITGVSGAPFEGASPKVQEAIRSFSAVSKKVQASPAKTKVVKTKKIKPSV